MAVNGVGGFNAAVLAADNQTGKTGESKSLIPFTDYLKDAMNEANELLLQSEQLNEDFAAGKTDSIHDVLIAGEKSYIALQFTLQIRNKVLDAYNEIMSMQI